ncbi:sensor histidine kinase VxrA [Vibrio hippocampi]
MAESLPERIDNFVGQFDYTNANASYDVRIIQADYPTQLLMPESMLPQTTKYPLKEVQQLYHLAQNCSGPLPLSPLITEPLVFTRAICNGRELAQRWFARSGLIHPGGGTYAARYINSHPEQKYVLEQYMHIKERDQAPMNSLLGRLQTMGESTVISLIRGSTMFVENEELWIRRGERYYLFSAEVWHANAQDSGLRFKLASNSETCFVRRGNICWETEDHTDLLKIGMISLIIANILLVSGWAIYRWNSKRKELRARMLVLQILTHELRTPIASLSLTVEGFRREFEQLPESVYDEFRRLCEDTRRLRQLAEASKDYLQSDNKPLATEWLPSVQEWLSFKAEEEFDGQVAINLDQDRAVKVNIYWLGTCIDNLIKNAIKYGVAPVTINVKTANGQLRIEVQDQGQLTEKDWRQLRQPFVSQAGLGLGLTIVESMVGRMGGKLTLVGPPTTFILEIPCETDTAAC